MSYILEWISQALRGEKRESHPPEVSALERFIENVYWAESLRADESKRRIEDAVVEIRKYGRHSSNGILVTTDGYFLTARHCVEDGLRRMMIRLADGEEYGVERVCAQRKNHDVALVKAAIPKESEALSYRFYNTTRMREDITPPFGIPITLLTRWEGELLKQGGWLNNYTNPRLAKLPDGSTTWFQDHCSGSIPTRPGDSGGSVVTTDGRLAGILSTGADPTHTSSSVKIIEALELVEFYVRRTKGKR